MDVYKSYVCSLYLGIEDHLLVERLLYTCLVPYSLDSEERMKKLYLLFATIDENASKAFIEVQKHQMQVGRDDC